MENLENPVENPECWSFPVSLSVQRHPADAGPGPPGQLEIPTHSTRAARAGHLLSLGAISTAPGAFRGMIMGMLSLYQLVVIYMKTINPPVITSYTWKTSNYIDLYSLQIVYNVYIYG